MNVAGADGGGCAGRAASFRHVSRVVCQVYPTVDLRVVLSAVGRHWLPRPCSSHTLIPGQTELSGRPRHRDCARCELKPTKQYDIDNTKLNSL